MSAWPSVLPLAQSITLTACTVMGLVQPIVALRGLP